MAGHNLGASDKCTVRRKQNQETWAGRGRNRRFNSRNVRKLVKEKNRKNEGEKKNQEKMREKATTWKFKKCGKNQKGKNGSKRNKLKIAV